MKDLIKKLFKFGIVGFSAFIIDYGLMVLFTELLGIDYMISSALSFTVSVIYNYILSILWVFDVNKKDKGLKSFIIFVILSVIGLLFNQLLMYVGTDMLEIHYMVTKIFVTAIVMVYNFITRKLFLEKNNKN